MSTFDPENFAFMEVTGSMSTERTPVPEAEYPAIVKDVIKPRQIETQDGPRWVCAVQWEIDDNSVRELTGLPHPTVRQDLWLDVSPAGALDMGKGKNVDMGKLREALGLNDPSKPFRFEMFKGRTARVMVKHTTKKDTGEIFANVSKVVAM